MRPLPQARPLSNVTSRRNACYNLLHFRAHAALRSATLGHQSHDTALARNLEGG